MHRCSSHRALLYTVSFTQTTHGHPGQSDSHRIDMTAASLHRAFHLQPRGLSRRATVAICLLVLHPIGVRRLSCASTATYPEPRGRASTRERGQGITRGGVAPLRIMSFAGPYVPEFAAPSRKRIYFKCYLLFALACKGPAGDYR
jgi:hypothetical protein